MSKKISFLIFGLIIVFGCIYFFINKNAEKFFTGTAKVIEVSDFDNSLALLDNGKKVVIHSNLIEEQEVIEVEGYQKNENYTVTKIYKNFENEEKKKEFIKEKIYDNMSMKNYINYLDMDKGTIIGVIPLQIQNQTYENMISPIEYVKVYKTLIALPVPNQFETYILKKKRDMRVLSVYDFSGTEKEKMDFQETDSTIEFINSNYNALINLNPHYYSVTVKIEDDIIEFLII